MWVGQGFQGDLVQYTNKPYGQDDRTAAVALFAVDRLVHFAHAHVLAREDKRTAQVVLCEGIDRLAYVAHVYEIVAAANAEFRAAA